MKHFVQDVGDPSGPVQGITSLLTPFALRFFIGSTSSFTSFKMSVIPPYPCRESQTAEPSALALLNKKGIKQACPFFIFTPLFGGLWSASGAGGSRTLVQIRYRNTVYMLWLQLIVDHEPDANALLKAYSLVFRACLEKSQITISTYRYFNRASVKRTISWSRWCLTPGVMQPSHSWFRRLKQWEFIYKIAPKSRHASISIGLLSIPVSPG